MCKKHRTFPVKNRHPGEPLTVMAHNVAAIFNYYLSLSQTLHEELSEKRANIS